VSIFAVVFTVLSSSWGFAWQTAVGPSFRGYPLSGDLTMSIKQEGLLFDRRTEADPLTYGLWQIKALASAAGVVEASASLYPVSYVRLTAGIGGTARYYNPPSLNCTYLNCQGFLQKNRLGFGFIIATGENKEWIVLPEYNLLQVTSAQTQLPNADETELIIANPAGDTLDQYSIIFGKKTEAKVVGLLIRESQYRSSGQHNEMQALISKSTWRDTSLVFGAGRYASDLNVPGFTAFFTYEWRWGYSQALF
jgi:hypothetical protein